MNSASFIRRSTLLIAGVLAAASFAQPPIPRDEIPERIRKGLATGNLDQQKAILTLIPEANLKGKLASVTASHLDDYLKTTTNDDCRILALIAYGKLSPPAAPAGRVVKASLASKNAAVRRAAGKALVFAVAEPAAAFSKPMLTPIHARDGTNLLAGAGPVIYWLNGTLDEGGLFAAFDEACRELLPACVQALNDDDHEVRASGAEAIRVLARSAAYALSDSSPSEAELDFASLRSQLLWYFTSPGLRAFDAAAPHLNQALMSPNVETRLAGAKAAEAVGHLRSAALACRRSTPFELPNYFRDVPEEDLLAAGTLKIQPALAQCLSDLNNLVRLNAAESFEHFGPHGRGQLDALLQASASRDLFVRWVTCRTLGRLLPDAEPREADRIVAALKPRVVETDLDVAAAALTSLAKNGAISRDAVGVVFQRIAKGDPDIRVQAIQTLEKIEPERVRTVPGMIQVLKADSPRVRKEAVMYLGRLGTSARAALPELRKLLYDEDEEVRAETAWAILAIERDL